jgi:hypothetical protein
VPCVVSSPTHPTDSSDLSRDCCKEHCIGARDNRLLADIGELRPAAGNELSDDSTDLDGEGPALVLPGLRAVRDLGLLGPEPSTLARIKPHGPSSQRARRWREMDSNFRFRMREAADLSFRFLSMSPKLSAF